MVAVMSGSLDRLSIGGGRSALAPLAVAALIGLSGLVSAAAGQTTVAPQASGPPGLGEGRRVIETIRIWKMSEALELNEDQAAKLFPKLMQLEASRREFHRRQRFLRNELQELLRHQPVREGEIKRRLEELERTEADFRGRERTVRSELQSILSLEQQARLTLFEERFEAEMRRAIQHLRGRQRTLPPGSGQGFGPPPIRRRSPLPVEGGPPPR